MLTVSSVKLVLLLDFSFLHIFDGKLFKAEGALLKTLVSSGSPPRSSHVVHIYVATTAHLINCVHKTDQKLR